MRKWRFRRAVGSGERSRRAVDCPEGGECEQECRLGTCRRREGGYSALFEGGELTPPKREPENPVDRFARSCAIAPLTLYYGHKVKDGVSILGHWWRCDRCLWRSPVELDPPSRPEHLCFGVDLSRLLLFEP